MKRCAWVVLLLFLAGCKANPTPPPPPVNADHSITMLWSQSEANNGPCSTSVTTSCLSGYSEGYMNGTTFEMLHTDTMAVCSGTAEPLACTTMFNATIPIGSIEFALVLDYKDQNGAAQTVAAVTTATPISVAADAPSGLTVTIQ
jgi:hypothetical protein